MTGDISIDDQISLIEEIYEAARDIGGMAISVQERDTLRGVLITLHFQRDQQCARAVQLATATNVVAEYVRRGILPRSALTTLFAGG